MAKVNGKEKEGNLIQNARGKLSLKLKGMGLLKGEIFHQLRDENITILEGGVNKTIALHVNDVIIGTGNNGFKVIGAPTNIKYGGYFTTLEAVKSLAATVGNSFYMVIYKGSEPLANVPVAYDFADLNNDDNLTTLYPGDSLLLGNVGAETNIVTKLGGSSNASTTLFDTDGLIFPASLESVSHALYYLGSNKVQFVDLADLKLTSSEMGWKGIPGSACILDSADEGITDEDDIRNIIETTLNVKLHANDMILLTPNVKGRYLEKGTEYPVNVEVIPFGAPLAHNIELTNISLFGNSAAFTQYEKYTKTDLETILKKLAANSVAVDEDYKILTEYLPDTVLGAVQWKGTITAEELTTADAKVLTDDTDTGDYYVYVGEDMAIPEWIQNRNSVATQQLRSGDWIIVETSTNAETGEVTKVATLVDHSEGFTYVAVKALSADGVEREAVQNTRNVTLGGSKRSICKVEYTEIAVGYHAETGLVTFSAPNALLVKGIYVLDNASAKYDLIGSTHGDAVAKSADILTNANIFSRAPDGVNQTGISINDCEIYRERYYKLPVVNDTTTITGRIGSKIRWYTNITDEYDNDERFAYVSDLLDILSAMKGNVEDRYIPFYNETTESFETSPLKYGNDGFITIDISKLGSAIESGEVKIGYASKHNQSTSVESSATTAPTEVEQLIPLHGGVLLNSNSVIDCGEWLDEETVVVPPTEEEGDTGGE